jgi:hypothetical protein
LSLAKGLGAKATAVTVSEPWAAARSCHGSVAVPFDAFEKAAGESATRILADVDEMAKGLDVACTTVHIKDLTAAEGIIHPPRPEDATSLSHRTDGWVLSACFLVVTRLVLPPSVQCPCSSASSEREASALLLHREML